MPGPASNNPRGHPTTAKSKKKSKQTSSLDSKKFLKEFFSPEYGGKPKSCKKKGVQCGLKGLAHDGDWPTVDVSSAPSGGPSGDGGGDGGGGGGGVGASVKVSKEKETMSTRFRRDMAFGRERSAAPPKELGSNPEELRKQFEQKEEMEPPVVVSEEDVEVMDEPSRYSRGEDEGGGDMGGEGGGEPSGMSMAEGDSPETAVEVGEEEVEGSEGDEGNGDSGEDEGRAEEASMTMRTGKDEPSAYELTEEEAAEVQELPEMGMGGEPSDDDDDDDDEKEPSCGCPSGHGVEDIPEVAVEDVEMLGEPSGEKGERAEEGGFAYARKATEGEPSSPSKGPSGKAPEDEDEKGKKEAAAELVEILTPIEALGEVDIADVELNLFNEDSDNPHYTVMVSGEPVAKIALSDQTLPPEHSDMFLQEEYPQSVLEGIETFGLQDTLQSVHARYYAARAYEGSVATRMKEAAAEELADTAKRHIAKVKDDLSNVAALVVEASLKNYIVTNPLRDALVANFHRAGIDSDAALDLVEDAFREAGAEYINTILNKAEEWMGAPKEAMEHHIKEITGMSYRHPGYAVADAEEDIPEAIEPESIPQMTTAAAPRNVPVRTVAAPTPQTRVASTPQNLSGNWQADKDEWKRRLNLFGRTASKAMALSADKMGRK